ncbi:hypothetical protein Pmani_005917 [Petrolisthes manimaculis]|uniref:alpha-L-fucosidase n=1 Tax=Petrolisthes manimaculis TaxID=1843537 RepID=A0AAE1PXQ9_9EUCA|nr:hypothetical protein Pmani_015832 [Petrolisthes manimaculis]KAK4314053.1 hypothetical protein Pmani_014643 [Petrolisthes manimaculis]KAK4316740.1 hypothetical protein Pmani_012148 [Petrolisthes manimaculis]KAK4318359.1 hypothetical protein Pmani_010657 [Petrolisthes manimaculis]KAK4319011.1 hypothetical protein Pmani_010096 [Petrolisthes manimaculis]
MERNFRPNFTYQDFAPHFTAEFFDPEQWAEVFQASGARYVVLTSKHHEGFTNWPSAVSWNWNSMDVGPKRDLVGDLAKAIRSKATDIHFGLYHSLFEWFNPLYLMDKKNNFSTNYFVQTKTMPELYELVSQYQPEVIWSDGDWEAHDWYWNSTVFLAWLFNSSPVKDTVVVNDRWGIGINCKHGSYYTCSDRYNPGNLLVNVGPTHDGRIPPIMEERLRQLGGWLDINGAAVYSTKPWTHQNDSLTHGVWYTSSSDGDRVYAMVLEWPMDNLLHLGSIYTNSTHTNITMLGYTHPLQFSQEEGSAAHVTFPPMSKVSNQEAWVLEMVGVS